MSSFVYVEQSLQHQGLNRVMAGLQAMRQVLRQWQQARRAVLQEHELRELVGQDRRLRADLQRAQCAPDWTLPPGRA